MSRYFFGTTWAEQGWTCLNNPRMMWPGNAYISDILYPYLWNTSSSSSCNSQFLAQSNYISYMLAWQNLCDTNLEYVLFEPKSNQLQLQKCPWGSLLDLYLHPWQAEEWLSTLTVPQETAIVESWRTRLQLILPWSVLMSSLMPGKGGMGVTW